MSFGIWKKKQQTIPKNRSRCTQKKNGNVKCNKTIIALHFVQCDVLWSTEKQYWPRPSALVNGLDQYCFSVLHSKSHCTQWSAITVCYYIDRCELWGFIREINAGISHVKYQFFPTGTTFTKLQVWWLCPLLCYGEYTYDCKLKKFREMLLMTLAHNQHDVIDIIWRLPVWNIKIRRYLALCTLQFWLNLTKASFQGKHFNNFCALL